MKNPKQNSASIPSALSPLNALEGTFEQLDPHSIVLSVHANRAPSDPASKPYIELRRLISNTHGNVIRAVVLEKPDTEKPKQVAHVLISGHRTWEICKELGLLMNVLVVRGLSELEVMRHMSMSNAGRKPLSALEAGRSFVRYLDSKYFVNQADLARELGVQPSDVSTAIKLSKLPGAIIAAFATPDDVQHRHAKELTDALKADEKKLLAAAKRLAKRQATLVNKLEPTEVMDELLAGFRKAKIESVDPEKSGSVAVPALVSVPLVEAAPVDKTTPVDVPVDDTVEQDDASAGPRFQEDADGQDAEEIPPSRSRPLVRDHGRAEASLAVGPSTEWEVALPIGAVVGSLTRFETAEVRIGLLGEMGLTSQDCIDLIKLIADFLGPRAFRPDDEPDDAS